MQLKSKDELMAAFAEAGSKLVVIDFFATWCGPCRNIAPILQQIAQDNADSIVVIKIDVDESQELAEDYNISSLPTFVFIKNGEKIDEFTGANSDKLKATIDKHK